MIPSGFRPRLGDTPGGVFYLHGEDEFGKEEAARALLESHVDPGTRDFNLDFLRGSDVDAERLASVLGTPPMMAEWRVVLLRETEALAGSPRARDALLDVVRNPPPGLALILMCSVPERSAAKFYKELEKGARALEFRAVGSNDLPGWILARAREHFNREMEEEAARAIAAAVGTDLAVVVRELEKLHTLADEGETLTLEHVKATGTRIPRQDRWEWFDLVGERRFREALSGLPILLQHGESGVGLTLALGTHLLRLGLTVAGGPGALEEALPRHQKFLARRYMGQARKWTLDEVEEALEELLKVDRLLKASGFSDRHLLESWLLARLAGGGEVAA